MYAAATREASWENALDALLLALDFTAATFYVHDRRAVTFDPAQPVVRHGMWHRLDPDGEREYREHYFRVDPRVAYTLAHPGTPLLHDQLYTSDDEMRRGEYRAWYRRTTGMEHTLGGHAGRTQPFFGAITLHRPKGAGASTPAEHRQFSVLFSHLQRALGVEYRLYQGGKASLLRALTDAGPNGVVLLDDGGQVIHANDAAISLAAAGALRLGRRLGARHCGADAALNRAVADVLAGRGSQTVRVPRPDGGRDQLVMLGPVSSPDPLGLFGRQVAAACAVIVDPEARMAPSADTLQAALCLSAAEARLLAALMDSRTIQEVAAATQVSPATLRTHLAALFRKTGTNRQVELVQLAHAVVRAMPRC